MGKFFSYLQYEKSKSRRRKKEHFSTSQKYRNLLQTMALSELMFMDEIIKYVLQGSELQSTTYGNKFKKKKIRKLEVINQLSKTHVLLAS